MSGLITIVGMGPGRPEHVTLEAATALREAGDSNTETFAFSNMAPLVSRLAPGLDLMWLDDAIADTPNRGAAYQIVIGLLMKSAFREGRRVYVLVPGNPFVVNDLSLLIRRTCERYKKPVRVIAGLSFTDVILDRIYWTGDPGLQLYSAWAVAGGNLRPNPDVPAILYELGEASSDPEQGRLMQSALTAVLLELYPEDHPAALLYSSGPPEFESCSEALAIRNVAGAKLPKLSNLWLPGLKSNSAERELAPWNGRGRDD